MEEAGPDGGEKQVIIHIRCCDKLPDDVISGSCTDRRRPPVHLPPCWILGRTRGADGGLEPSQGTKATQLEAENQEQVREFFTSCHVWCRNGRREHDLDLIVYHATRAALAWSTGRVHQVDFEIVDYLCI